MLALAANGYTFDRRATAVAHLGSHRYSVVPATPEHVYDLAANLRPADEAEILGSGHGVKRSLWRGYRNSVLCETAIVDAKVAAMWGLTVGFVPGLSLLGNTGRPWLLTSPLVEQVPFAVVREAKRAVMRMLAVKPLLENYVLASYEKAVRLVRLVGFTVDDPIVNQQGIAYHRFHMSRQIAIRRTAING